MRKFIMPFMAAAMAGSVSFAAPPTIPTSAAPTSVPTAPPPMPSVVAQPITAELIDGSKVEIDADGTVWVLSTDGSKTAAPDGMLALKDGTPFTVKEGKRVPGDN